MQSVIRVELPEQSYDIAIASGSLDQLGEQCSGLSLGKKVLVVSNPVVYKHYGERAIASLTSAGFDVYTCVRFVG